MANRRPVCNPKTIIRHTEPREEIRYHDGDTGDIIETILVADAQSAEYIDQEGLYCLRGKNDRETLKNVWAFVKYNLRYRPDRRGHEQVKKPGPLFSTGVGDCKSYSIAIGAILRALGYGYRYRFTAYKPGEVTHVYVVATDRRGEPVILDAVHDTFNEEVRYLSKRDIKPTSPRQHTMDAIGAISIDATPFILAGLAGVFIWLLMQRNDAN